MKSPEHAGGDAKARHFGVELFENDVLGDWRGRLEKAGVPLKIEEQVTCCYAVGDKFWAQDPDGNDWEFWVRSAEADAMHGDSTAGCSTEAACCTPQEAAVAMEAAKASSEAPCCTPDTAGKSGCC